MREWRRQETMHAYNSELAVLASRKGGKGGAAARRLLSEMADNGIPRDVHSFNMALEACKHDLPACLRVYDGMRAEGLVPDAFALATVATALAREEQADGALQVLRLLGAGAPGRAPRDSWPVYYQSLWPSTVKALNKALLQMAEGDPRRCVDVCAAMRALASQLGTGLYDPQTLAEQLTSHGLCQGCLSSITGGVLRGPVRQERAVA
jgi:hypothetical protein